MSKKKPNVQPPAQPPVTDGQPPADSQQPPADPAQPPVEPTAPPAPTEQPKAPADGMVLMRAADGCGGFSFNGQSYSVIDGLVKVPQEAVEAAKDHGFTEVDPQ